MILATILALILLLFVPGQALWRSLGDRPARSMEIRFRATITQALALLSGLLLVALTNRMTAADLGIGMSLGVGGRIGLAIAAAVVLGLTIAVIFAKPKRENIDKHRASGLMPEGPRQLRLFLFMTILIGFAWEVLYRGFLLWWLIPATGTVAAVLIASLAYGLAHGWQDNRQGVGSIIAALLFTSGYALTGSLWWLIVIHIALPLIGYAAVRRAASARSFEQAWKPA